MRRAELEHVIRAAAEITGDSELVIVGSQAILGAHPDAPPELLVSREADIFPRNHPERAIEIDGAMGDGSLFDETYGYYAHGVGPETARLPEGWEERLVAVSGPSTGGATGWCLEPHDLVLSKCVAGREQDWRFARDALSHRLVDPETLRRRARALPISPEERGRILQALRLD